VTQQIADHVLAVVREGLTNAGKHGRATRYSVSLTVDDSLRLEVTDDGVGIAVPMAERQGMGLTNLRHRAEKLGGTFSLTTPEGGGTHLLWCVPY
jgi:signal transduction histidine kinase